MSELRYEAPASIEMAVELLADNDGKARIFAGGTDLLVQMREDLIKPLLLIDIKKIEEVSSIAVDSEGFHIGASVCSAKLGEHVELKTTWPGLVEAAELIGSEQVQGRATLGGNLCNASPAADTVPALIAANAQITIAGPSGRRKVAVTDIPIGPGKTSLQKNEFVVSVNLPKPPARNGDAYLRFIPRTEMDIAVVGAGISISLNENGTCATARLALGAVGPTAQIVDAASEILIGNNLNDDVLDALGSAASHACSPIDDKRGTIDFRTKVAGVLARRVALIAWQRAKDK